MGRYETCLLWVFIIIVDRHRAAVNVKYFQAFSLRLRGPEGAAVLPLGREESRSDLFMNRDLVQKKRENSLLKIFQIFSIFRLFYIKTVEC